MSKITDKILTCCSNQPSFLVTYKIGSKFYVCDSCISIDYWSRGIKEKAIIKADNTVQETAQINSVLN